MNVALLMGGSSAEREVSLLSAQEIITALDTPQYTVIPIEIQPGDHRAWVRQLMDANPSLAVIALHGGLGENGAVQGLLECLGVPYLGSKVLGSALCMDKHLSKFILRANMIPVADDILLPHGESVAARSAEIRRLGFPLVVKPNHGGSSIGVSIVPDWETLEDAVDKSQTLYSDDLLIEQWVNGKEVTCGVIETPEGLTMLPVLDIQADGVFYDYEAKYISERTRIENTSLPPFLRGMIEQIAARSFKALHCREYARVDMMAQEEQIRVLEVNTLPGLTAHSLIPKAAKLAGMGFSSLLDTLIKNNKKTGEM